VNWWEDRQTNLAQRDLPANKVDANLNMLGTISGLR